MKNIKECIKFIIDRSSSKEDYNIAYLAKKELEQLQAEQQAHNDLNKRLNEIEFIKDYGSGRWFCPVCENEIHHRHTEDCWLAQAIKEDSR